MKRYEFVNYVAKLVSKTAGQPLQDVDPEANVLAYFDDGMEVQDQVACAHLAATSILEENGYIVVE